MGLLGPDFDVPLSDGILGMATSLRKVRDEEERTDTRTNIKVAARKLFAERGLEAVTVREIVAAAGAKNGGSLNYYFKSKEGLIRELLNEVFKDFSRAWLEALSELDKKGGPTSVKDIVDIIVRAPNADAYTDPSPTAHRFLAGVLFMRRKELANYLEQMNLLIFSRMLQLIVELKSDIPESVMRQRLIFFAWYILSVQAAHEAWRASKWRSDVWRQPEPLLHLVDTATALLETPVTPAETLSKNEPAVRSTKRRVKSDKSAAPSAS